MSAHTPYTPSDLITLHDGRLASIVRVEHLKPTNVGLLFEWRITVVTENSQQYQLFR